MGGGKGGSDFDPKGKTDNEIRRFSQAFMRELARHIGASTDVPAGDIGVSSREIGFLFGAYRQQRNFWEGVLTGKGGSWGGSPIRPEATGYGLIYVRRPSFTIPRCGSEKLTGRMQYVQHMIQYASDGKESFKGKRVAISGSGNVAQYAALKAKELGATIVSLSDSQGALVATNEEGIQPEHVQVVQKTKENRKPLSDLVETDGFKEQFKYIAGARPWTHVGKVDIALPSATQNEVSGDEAKALVEAGVKFIAEGSNMGCTQEAIEIFEETRKSKKKDATWYGPGKGAFSPRSCRGPPRSNR